MTCLFLTGVFSPQPHPKGEAEDMKRACYQCKPNDHEKVSHKKSKIAAPAHRHTVDLSHFFQRAYNVLSASWETHSSSNQKSYNEQGIIRDLNFNRLPSPSPCPSFMSLSSRNLYSPSPCPLHNLPFLPFSRDLSHGTVTDSVKKEWFEAVMKDDLAILQHILLKLSF